MMINLAIGDIFTVLAIIASCFGSPIAGPFRVIPERSEICPPEMIDYPFAYHTRPTRDRANVDRWYTTVNVTSSVPYSDDYDVRFEMASWSSRGGWKENALILNVKKTCTVAKTHFPGLFRKFIRAMANRDDCPIPAGTYYARDVPVDLTTGKVNAFFYGKWRTDGKLMDPKTNKVAACARTYVRIVPLYPYRG